MYLFYFHKSLNSIKYKEKIQTQMFLKEQQSYLFKYIIKLKDIYFFLNKK